MRKSLKLLLLSILGIIILLILSQTLNQDFSGKVSSIDYSPKFTKIVLEDKQEIGVFEDLHNKITKGDFLKIKTKKLEDSLVATKIEKYVN